MRKDEELSKINVLDGKKATKLTPDQEEFILFSIFMVPVIILMLIVFVHINKKSNKRNENEALYDRQVIVTTESKTYNFITDYNNPYSLHDDSINITDKMTGEKFTIQSKEMEIKENVIQEQHRIEAFQ